MSLVSVSDALAGRVKAGSAVTVQGWVRTRRDSKAGLSFIHLTDGSCFDPIQIVADGTLAPKMAVILQQLGARHALIVHSEDGLDEISLGARTRVHEVRDGAMRSFTVTPDELGLSAAGIEELAGGDKEQNARIIRSLFDGDAGPKRNALLANAGAALYAADKVESIRDGVALAAKTIDGGAARKTLQQYVDLTQSFG